MPGWGVNKTVQTLFGVPRNFAAWFLGQIAGWRGWSSRLLKLLPGPLLVVLVAIVNPLGINSSSGQISLDGYRRIAANAYPDTGQKKIAVVQIDDRSLAASGESHPPSFDFYERLIREIKAAGAESILLDLMIIDRDRQGKPGGLDRLAASMDGLPVFMTAAQGGEDGESGCAAEGRQNIEELRRAVSVEPHPMIRDQASHVDLFLDDYCGSPRLSAALAVYMHHCGQKAGCRGSEHDPLTSPAAFRDKTLTIEWGRVWPTGIEAIHTGYRRLAATCPDGSFPDVAGSLAGILMPFGSDERFKAPAGCTYHPVIRAEWLTAPDSSQDVDHAALKDFLAGRIVVVGAKFAGIPDVGPSPVFGNVPGMFLHAMAIDNLIVRGAGFMTEWPEWKFGDLDMSGLAEFAAMLAFAAAANVLGRRIAPQTLRAALAWSAALVVAGMAVGLALTAGVVWLWRLEPANWIGVAFAGVMIAGPARTALSRMWQAARLLDTQANSQNGGQG